MAAKINLAAVLEHSPIGRLQLRVFTLCMICLVMDGFDVQAMGYAAPYVSREWNATSLRSTGLGWALGIGRFGAIVGPYAGGMLIASKWTNQQLFLAAAVPAVVSMAIMISLRLVTNQRGAGQVGHALTGSPGRTDTARTTTAAGLDL